MCECVCFFGEVATREEAFERIKVPGLRSYFTLRIIYV